MTRARMYRVGYLVQSPLADLPENLGHRIYILALAAALRRAGHDLTILNLGDAATHSVTAHGAIDIPVSGGRRFALRAMESASRRLSPLPEHINLGMIDSLRFADACRRMLEHCDVLHEHAGLLQWGGAQAARGLRRPYVLHVHS